LAGVIARVWVDAAHVATQGFEPVAYDANLFDLAHLYVATCPAYGGMSALDVVDDALAKLRAELHHLPAASLYPSLLSQHPTPLALALALAPKEAELSDPKTLEEPQMR